MTLEHKTSHKGHFFNLRFEKILFKVIKIKFLAMHFTNQKFSFDIFTKYLHGT